MTIADDQLRALFAAQLLAKPTFDFVLEVEQAIAAQRLRSGVLVRGAWALGAAVMLWAVARLAGPPIPIAEPMLDAAAPTLVLITSAGVWADHRTRRRFRAAN